MSDDRVPVSLQSVIDALGVEVKKPEHGPEHDAVRRAVMSLKDKIGLAPTQAFIQSLAHSLAQQIAGDPWKSTSGSSVWADPKTCDHAGYSFAKMGRRCFKCGTFMVDWGD